MLNQSYPYYLANQAVTESTEYLAVTDKYTGKVITKVARADPDAVESAITAAVKATAPLRQLKAYQRQAILQDCISRMTNHSGVKKPSAHSSF